MHNFCVHDVLKNIKHIGLSVQGGSVGGAPTILVGWHCLRWLPLSGTPAFSSRN